LNEPFNNISQAGGRPIIGPDQLTEISHHASADGAIWLADLTWRDGGAPAHGVTAISMAENSANDFYAAC